MIKPDHESYVSKSGVFPCQFRFDTLVFPEGFTFEKKKTEIKNIILSCEITKSRIER